MKRFISILSLAALVAALAFAAGRWLGGRKQTGIVARVSGSANWAEIVAPPVRLPPADFQDAEGFAAYVARLRATGLDESLAKWLAISAKVRVDLPKSLVIARKAGLLREWAVAVAMDDPKGGYALLQSVVEGTDFTGDATAQGVFFQTLGRTNPKLGVDLLSGLSGWKGLNLAGTFFGSWSRVDPFAAMDCASKQTQRWLREGSYTGIFREWGRRDMREMMRWASNESPEMARLAFRSQHGAGTEIEAEELLAVAREFPDSVDPTILVNGIGSLIAQGAKGWKPIADFPPGKMRESMISWFANRFSENDPKGAWEFAKTLSPEDRALFCNWTVRRRLASIAPREMAQISVSADDADVGSVSEVVSAWADKEPHAAFQWSQQNLHGRSLAEAMESGLSAWAKKDPAAASAALDGLSPGMSAKLLPDLVGGWVQGDNPKAALAYSKQQPPLDRQRMTNEAIRSWAYRDPEAAAAALAAEPPAGLGGAYDQIAWRLADKDPGHAIDWAAGVADSGMSVRAVEKITQEWSEKDAAAASGRVARLEPGAFRDGAVKGLVRSLQSLDPGAAADWATSLGDAKSRHDNLLSVLGDWKKKNPAAAATFAQKMAPSPLRDELMKLVHK